jgi:hypothetical protein
LIEGSATCVGIIWALMEFISTPGLKFPDCLEEGVFAERRSKWSLSFFFWQAS